MASLTLKLSSFFLSKPPTPSLSTSSTTSFTRPLPSSSRINYQSAESSYPSSVLNPMFLPEMPMAMTSRVLLNRRFQNSQWNSAEEQERDFVGVRANCAAGIYGIIYQKGSTAVLYQNRLEELGTCHAMIINSSVQVAENLAQVMYSVLMTGYMFRNAQYRLELQQSLEQVALPEPQVKKDVPDYAPGTQKNVIGEVIRWNNISGLGKIDAVKYIELLEAEIEELNRQVARKSTNEQNELMEYLKSLEPQNLKELTSSAGEDAVLAMNTFIRRLLAVSESSQMKLYIRTGQMTISEGWY